MSHGPAPGSQPLGNCQEFLELIRYRISFQNSRDIDLISKGTLAQITSRMFFPLAVSMVLSSTIGIVDMYIAGFLGTNAQAAVGLGDQLLFLALVLGTGMATACSSFISRSFGARDFAACCTYARASLMLSTGVGILSAVIGMFCAAPILNLLGCDKEVAVLAVPYTTYNAIANAPFVVSLCLSAIFRALGRPILSVYLFLVTALLTNGLCVAAYFSGISEFRSLDALAFGWDIGCSVGCAYGLFLFRKIYREMSDGLRPTRATHGVAPTVDRGSDKCDDGSNKCDDGSNKCDDGSNKCDDGSNTYDDGSGTCVIDRELPATVGAMPCIARDERMPSITNALKDLICIGAPAVVTELSLVISHFLMYRLLACAPESTATLQAAWTIKLKLEESLALIPLLALGMSTGVIVGQNIGAGDRKQASRACLSIAATAALVMFILGGLISLTAPQLAASFSSDQPTREAIVSLLTPSVFLFPFCALSSILCAGLEGAGDTRIPMILNLTFQVGGRTVLAFYLGVQQGLNLAGIGMGLCLAQALMSIAVFIYSYIKYGGHALRLLPEH